MIFYYILPYRIYVNKNWYQYLPPFVKNGIEKIAIKLNNTLIPFKWVIFSMKSNKGQDRPFMGQLLSCEQG